MVTLILALAALFVIFCVACVLTETEKFGWASFTLILTVVGVQLFHVVDLLAYARGHLVQTLLYVGGYLLIGVVWSFIKWFSFLMGFRDEFKAGKAAFLNGLKLNPEGQVPEDQMDGFQNFMHKWKWGGYHGNDLTMRPRASNNKARITSWMSLWPYSVVGTVLNDPIKRLFTWLFNGFKALYQKMSDAIFAKHVELK